MSNKKKTVISIFSNWVGYLTVNIVKFFATPIIILSLGNERYGIWSLINVFISYYQYLNIGISDAVIKYYAEYQANNDQKASNGIFNTGLGLCLIIAIIVIVSSFFVANYFYTIFKITYKNTSVVKTSVILIGILTGVNFLCNPCTGIIAALNRFEIINILFVLKNIIEISIVVLLLKLGHGLLALAFITLLIGIIQNIFVSIISFKISNGLELNFSLVNKKNVRKIYNFGIYEFFRNISNLLINNSDIIIIGIILGPKEVSYYEIAQILMKFGKQMRKSIMRVLMPLSSTLYAEGKHYEIKRLIINFSKYGLIIGFFIFNIYFFMGRQFIDLWMGPGYKISYAILSILLIQYICVTTHQNHKSTLTGIGKNKFVGILSLLEGITKIIFCIILANRYGLYGVAFGSVIPIVISYFFILPIYTCNVFNIPFHNYLLNVFFPPIFCIFPTSLLAFYFGKIYISKSLTEILLQIAILGIVLIFLCLIFCQDEYSEYIISNIPFINKHKRTIQKLYLFKNVKIFNLAE